MAKGSAAKKLQQQPEEALEEIRGIQQRLGRQIEEARTRIAEQLSEQLEDMRDRFEDARTRATDAWLDGMDYARERPTQVALIAVGAGLAIGAAIYLLSSRRPSIEDY